MQRTIQTAAFAKQLGYSSASIRTAIWRKGHFNGITPIKLPNGRLLWPADAVDRLIAHGTEMVEGVPEQ